MLAAVSGLLAAVWLISLRRSSGRARLVLMLMPGVVAMLVVVAILGRNTFAEWIGRDATFTGRTSTWGLLVDTWERRPLQGFGFFAGWFDSDLRAGLREIGYNHWEAHNGYLEVLLGAGIIGVVALGWFLFTALRALWSRANDEWAPTWLGLMVFALVSNIGETNIGANRLVWFVVIAVVAAPR